MKQLMSRWRLPSLTIHKVDVSGPGTTTVIPHTVTAYVSMRIVPDQSVQGVCSKFEEHVGQEFKRLQSRNQLKVLDRRSSFYPNLPNDVDYDWKSSRLVVG